MGRMSKKLWKWERKAPSAMAWFLEAENSPAERGGPLVPGHLHLPFSPQGGGCPLPSNPGLYSMHNHCKGTPRPG